ncbi:MAG: hypothetical protein KDA21_03470, partial [Phycisphaerales bacterium]|nr:hypothetical protein [Phycisphaerales bacterium]
MRDQRLTAAMVLALLSGTAYAADWSGVIGNWNDPSQWSPMNVPNVAGESAVLPNGMYTLTLNTSITIDSLTINGPDAMLDMPAPWVITMLGDIHNDGLIRMATINSASDSVIQFGADALLTGTGEILLIRTGNDNRLETLPGFTVTNDVNHTIRGGGDINAQLVNNGTIVADINWMTIAGNRKVNNGLM